MSNFDLSKFPKIVLEQKVVDVEKQSESLKAVRSSMENLLNLIQIYYTELSSLDDKSKYLEKVEAHLKEYEFELTQKEKTLLISDEAVKKEKEYIDNANRDIKTREAKLVQEKNYLLEIENAKLEWEERKTEALKAESVAEEKMKLIEVLNKKQQELDEKEAMMEKSSAIDAERKRLLDIREERIKSKEMRLYIEQEE